MRDELAFRTIIAVAALLMHANHRLHCRTFDTAHVAGIGETSLNTAACLWAASLFLYAFGFQWFDYPAGVPRWLRGIGVATFVLCIPLSLWVYRTLGPHFSPKLQLRDDHELVCCGPYRFVRHPMYATFFLCAVSAALVSSNLVVAVLGATTGVIMMLRVRKEEEMLCGRFGTHYSAYAERTGAFVPKLRMFLRDPA